MSIPAGLGKLASRGGRRRAGGVAAAIVLTAAVASSVYACTSHIGTLTVCSPPGSTTCVSATAGYPPTGSAAASSSGSAVSIQGQSFNASTYSIKFLNPAGVSAGKSCHSGGTKLGQNVKGPTFDVTRTTPATGTGNAALCVQSRDGTGNEVPVSVV